MFVVGEQIKHWGFWMKFASSTFLPFQVVLSEAFGKARNWPFWPMLIILRVGFGPCLGSGRLGSASSFWGAKRELGNGHHFQISSPFFHDNCKHISQKESEKKEPHGLQLKFYDVFSSGEKLPRFLPQAILALGIIAGSGQSLGSPLKRPN